MNVDITRGYDSFFGPPSEPISVRKFLDDSTSLGYPSASDLLRHTGWQCLSEEEQSAVEAECSESVTELKSTVEKTWNNPMLSAHLYRTHAAAINAIHSQAGGLVSKERKRKHLPDPDVAEAQPEVRALQEKLETISLQCWELKQDAAFFMRASKHSDFNALEHVKKSGRGSLTCALREDRNALVTLTVHNRVPWIHSQLTRFSQHTVLSSQTLADFVRVIPCDSGEMPREVVSAHGNVVGYMYESEEQGREAASCAEEGCLLLIEGVVYGDGQHRDDYADKFLSHLQSLPEEKRPQITKASTSLSQTPFTSLALRINQPYWMLHRGNCEHFVVVDQIRLPHPHDPPSGYPLTICVTPTLGDVCKACNKVPAVLTVVGDIRLGESPCLLCAPCWRNMGPPREEDMERVMVVPLVKHCRRWEDGADM